LNSRPSGSLSALKYNHIEYWPAIASIIDENIPARSLLNAALQQIS